VRWRVLREFVPTRSDDQSCAVDRCNAALRDEALWKIITELDNA
jgi:hypothetical protein